MYAVIDAARAQLGELGLTVAGLTARPAQRGRRWCDLDSGALVRVPAGVELDMTHDPVQWWRLAEHLGVNTVIVTAQVFGWRLDLHAVAGGMAWSAYTVLPRGAGALAAGAGEAAGRVERIALRRSFGDTHPARP